MCGLPAKKCLFVIYDNDSVYYMKAVCPKHMQVFSDQVYAGRCEFYCPHKIDLEKFDLDYGFVHINKYKKAVSSLVDKT